MKEGYFMRLLFCKIHCPFICFCKPSAAPLYTSGPLKLEYNPHEVPSAAADDSSGSDKSSSAVKEEEEEAVNGKEEEAVNGKEEEAENAIKSCIRKVPNEPIGKKRVQWRDTLGKELAEIKEFESSETGDTEDEEESSRCLCIIL